MRNDLQTSVSELLARRQLVHSALPTVSHVSEKLNACKHIRLVYGETYDEFGPTIDSLKYYFFVALLKRELEKMGTVVDATIIVGDLHSTMNKLVKDKEALLGESAQRLQFVCKISDRFKLNLKPVRMSELFQETSFSERLKTIRPAFENSPELREVARTTVLRNRLKQEEQVGFQYTLEEVSLITGYDVKIGPPREAQYDRIARSVGSSVGNKDFCGLYLTPAYPLGVGFDYFISHPEIEEYGLTPYKAGSNKLQANRILLGKTGRATCKELISMSFTPINPALPNAVFDL